MIYTSALLKSGRRRLAVWQSVIVLMVGCVVWMVHGHYYGLSVFYGGGLALVISFLLGWRLQKVVNLGRAMNGFDLLQISFGALERFVLVALGMACGIAWIGLAPWAMILGFTAAQIGYFFKMPDRPA